MLRTSPKRRRDGPRARLRLPPVAGLSRHAKPATVCSQTRSAAQLLRNGSPSSSAEMSVLVVSLLLIAVLLDDGDADEGADQDRLPLGRRR